MKGIDNSDDALFEALDEINTICKRPWSDAYKIEQIKAVLWVLKTRRGVDIDETT